MSAALRLLPTFLVPVGAVLLSLGIWASSQLFSAWNYSKLDWVRAGASVLTLSLVAAYPWLSGRVRGGRKAFVATLGALTLLSAIVSVEPAISRHFGENRQVSTWNFFHYYLGSKYFAEVGYDGLYEEMLKADQQGERRFRKATRYRDMSNYRVVSTKRVRKQPRREAWTDERWEEFQRDVDTIGSFQGRRFWSTVLTDRGYNPPPGWTLLGGLLSRNLDPSNYWSLTTIMLFDPALILIAFWVSTQVYGWWRSLVFLAAATMWIGSHRFFGGKFLQYDWLAACWLAFASMKRERWVLAGALIAYATSVRVFPGVFMLGPLAQSLWALIREKRIPRHLLKLLGSGAATLGLLVTLSGITCGRGIHAWVEFTESIQEHNYHHKYTETRIGLPFLTTASFATGIGEDVPRSRRKVIYEENSVLRHSVQALLIALLFLAVRREDTHDAAILSLVVMFALAVSSRYYGIIYALFLLRHIKQLLPEGGGQRGAQRVTTRWYWMGLSFLVFTALAYIPVLTNQQNRVIYMLANMGILAYLVASLTLALFEPNPRRVAAEATAAPA